MKKMIFPLVLIVFFLFGCSGEGYVKVANLTPSSVLLSVNDEADIILASGDTSDTYTIDLVKGTLANVSVEATGDWIGEYSQSVSVANGESILHKITSTVANLTIENGSSDSAMFSIENYQPLYFAGNDEITAPFQVDASVDVEYAGRYMFLIKETKSWFPGNAYTYILEPNACEIRLDNLHPNRAIYYVYLSQSTDESWGEDDFGDDILYPGEAFLWKAEGDVKWDMRVEAGDPHADSSLFVYDFFDLTGSPSDATYIYEFPNIFTPVEIAKIAKTEGGQANYKKTNSLNKNFETYPQAARLEKLKKVSINSAETNILRKK
ncbi:MAG: hypothetical protein WCT23_04380 [Candidatus Neomarinimicrobiota bacterium]